MKHIYTLTLNPALDKSTSVERVEPERALQQPAAEGRVKQRHGRPRRQTRSQKSDPVLF